MVKIRIRFIVISIRGVGFISDTKRQIDPVVRGARVGRLYRYTAEHAGYREHSRQARRKPLLSRLCNISTISFVTILCKNRLNSFHSARQFPYFLNYSSKPICQDFLQLSQLFVH